MSEGKHTPGPWKVFKQSGQGPDGTEFIGIESDEYGIIGSVGYAPTRANQDANARLIAAAPELLAALQEIAEGKGTYSRNPLTHASNTIDEMKNTAQIAIGKAIGGM